MYTFKFLNLSIVFLNHLTHEMNSILKKNQYKKLKVIAVCCMAFI